MTSVAISIKHWFSVAALSEKDIGYVISFQRVFFKNPGFETPIVICVTDRQEMTD